MKLLLILLDFTINRAASSITATGSTTFTYNGGQHRAPLSSFVTGSTGAVTYSYSGTSNGGVSYGPSATPPTLAGRNSMTATVAQDDNYNEATSVSRPTSPSTGLLHLSQWLQDQQHSTYNGAATGPCFFFCNRFYRRGNLQLQRYLQRW